MKEMLLSQKEFKISSPLNPDRTIKFTEDFKDSEFDSYIVAGDRLLLKVSGQTVARLTFYKDHLEGDDSRGGKTTIYPMSPNVDKFINSFKAAHAVEPLIKEEKETELVGKTAIVSKGVFEGYHCVDPRTKRLFDVYDDLFSTGYDYVFYIDCPTTKHFTFLLENLSKKFLTGQRIGSVQVCSKKSSEEGGAVSFEDGDWRGFSIDKTTWLKIKSKMSDKKLNFFRGLTVYFKEKNLVRISTDLSRDIACTPQDKSRVNFHGI